MQLLYVGVIRNNSKPAHEIASAKNVESFGMFERSTVSTFLTYFACLSAERTAPGARQSVEENKYMFHTFSHPCGCAAVMVTDHEYPRLTAHRVLTEIVEEDFLRKYPQHTWATKEPCPTLDMPSLKDYLSNWKDPYQQDSILKVKYELDETKIVLHKTMESLLERGEKLDSLVERSAELSNSSKMFYRQAKKQNSCCSIM